MITVEASEYVGRALTGRSRPMLCTCEEPEGSTRDVYVKYAYFHEELTTDHLVAEIVANRFALDLGLPAAEPCLVNISPEFVDTLPNSHDGTKLAEALKGAPVIAFGSTKLSPVRRWEGTDLIHKNQLREAAMLYLFDTIVENSDRGIGNPNLLMSGLAFKIIDFGHCFQRCRNDADFRDGALPWSRWAIQNHYPGTMQHIMYNSCRNIGNDVLQDFSDALVNLTDDRIESYIDVVPAAWGHEAACKIIEYLIQARIHAPEFMEQVRGVLK